MTSREPEIKAMAEMAKIDKPAKQLEKSLSSYLSSRLDNLRKSDELGAYIQESIIDRLAEFSANELIEVYRTHGELANAANRDVLVPFSNASEGNLLDSLRKSDEVTSGQAAQLAESISDKDQLQALAYLSQITEALSRQKPVIAEYIKVEDVKGE